MPNPKGIIAYFFSTQLYLSFLLLRNVSNIKSVTTVPSLILSSHLLCSLHCGIFLEDFVCILSIQKASSSTSDVIDKSVQHSSTNKVDHVSVLILFMWVIVIILHRKGPGYIQVSFNCLIIKKFLSHFVFTQVSYFNRVQDNRIKLQK